MKTTGKAAGIVAAIALAAGVLGQDTRAQGERRLIIHADDLGMSHAVNRATLEALEHGWVTSASILVPCPWFPEVAAWARTHQDADLGIHLALNSEWTTFRWGPVSGRAAVPSLLDDQGYLPLLEDEVVRRAKLDEAEKELRAQVDFARQSGVNVTHLDSHMATLFRSPELFGVYRKLADAYHLPRLIEVYGERGGAESAWMAAAAKNAPIDRVVSINPGVQPSGWLAAYKKMLEPLPPGTYQLIVHLGYDDQEMRGATSDHPNWGAAWRQSDFDLVKSDEFREFLKAQHFTLTSWHELGKKH
jgi:predicted glycoside hydrolase/deacetylase ChbG (UPF0249 family)